MLKYYCLILLVNLLFREAKSQLLPQKFTLEKYAPQITIQDGENCFAYASTYVALSTQFAYLHHVKADSLHAFSFGYVDGAINFIGENKVRKLAWQKKGGEFG